MSEELKVVLRRSEQHSGFGFSLLGTTGPPHVIYDIVENSPAADCGAPIPPPHIHPPVTPDHPPMTSSTTGHWKQTAKKQKQQLPAGLTFGNATFSTTVEPRQGTPAQ
ncbi:GM26447 [Drosophila sechellia]|uniref:GM26447 n=1 Tax=Drosophila sechellia TaxID=7238 RepID=B4HEQ4_DROSE|nr:GM26447 [Drosophila sechellia]